MSRSVGQRVYYFIPEDGDEEAHPNVYTLPANSDVDLSLLQRTFPVQAGPGEVLVFRFKFQQYKKRYVWMDLPSPDAPLPLFNGHIIMKVTRLYTDGAVAPAAAPPPVHHHESARHVETKLSRGSVGSKNSSSRTSPATSPGNPATGAADKAPVQPVSKPREPSVDFFADDTSSASGQNASAPAGSPGTSPSEQRGTSDEEAAFFSMSATPAPAPSEMEVNFFGSATDPVASAPAPAADTDGGLLGLDFSAPAQAASPAANTTTSTTTNSNSTPDVFGDMLFKM